MEHGFNTLKYALFCENTEPLLLFTVKRYAHISVTPINIIWRAGILCDTDEVLCHNQNIIIIRT